MTEITYSIYKSGCVNSILCQLNDSGYQLNRDVIISSSSKKEADLLASKDDFWYHSDGCFQIMPPEIVLIQLLTQDLNSQIFIFDSNNLNLNKSIFHKKLRFGLEGCFIESSMFTNNESSSIFRYRKDYMMPLPYFSEKELRYAHKYIYNIIQKYMICLADFSQGDVLILNNHRFLHRRSEIHYGTRTIRRLWLNKNA